MVFDFKKFLASGKPPTEAIARGGSRPKGSPPPTVFKGPQDKKKKVVTKKGPNLLEKTRSKLKQKKEREKANITRREMLYPKRNLTKEQFLKVYSNQIIDKAKKDSKSKTKTHSIKFGDTLSGIAKKYNVSVSDIMSKNPQIKDANKITAGTNLNISKKRFGGIAIKGVKEPNKIFKG
jgi:LysM repeat protein